LQSFAVKRSLDMNPCLKCKSKLRKRRHLMMALKALNFRIVGGMFCYRCVSKAQEADVHIFEEWCL